MPYRAVRSRTDRGVSPVLRGSFVARHHRSVPCRHAISTRHRIRPVLDRCGRGLLVLGACSAAGDDVTSSSSTVAVGGRHIVAEPARSTMTRSIDVPVPAGPGDTGGLGPVTDAPPAPPSRVSDSDSTHDARARRRRRRRARPSGDARHAWFVSDLMRFFGGGERRRPDRHVRVADGDARSPTIPTASAVSGRAPPTT